MTRLEFLYRDEIDELNKPCLNPPIQTTIFWLKAWSNFKRDEDRESLCPFHSLRHGPNCNMCRKEFNVKGRDKLHGMGECPWDKYPISEVRTKFKELMLEEIS